MFAILKEYGVMIFLVLILVLELFILIFKRKPKTLDEFLSILHEVAANYLPSMISEVEKPGCGVEKKESVVAGAYKLVKKQLGRKLSTKELEVFKNYISEEIEMILMTPEKKGV